MEKRASHQEQPAPVRPENSGSEGPRRGRKPPRRRKALPDKLILPQEAETFHVYSDQTGMRLDQFLKMRLHWRSRTKVQDLIETRDVTAHSTPLRAALSTVEGATGGVRVGRAYRVKLAEEIRLPLPPPPEDAYRIAEIPLEILFEDDLLVILNKPPHLVVHPAGRHRYDTLINALHLRYRDLKDPKKDILPKLAHRIDRETSGVLIGYKMRRHERHSPVVFERSGVAKEYLTIAEGILPQDSGLIDLPIGRQPGVDNNRATCAIVSGGQPSRTGYEVLERFRTPAAGPNAGFTFLRCRLFTGRMHQIRVHLRAIGHPVLCDKLYGLRRELRLSELGPLPEGQEDCVLLSRHALHAQRITFTHPATRKPVTVEAPLPGDMQRVLEALRAK